METLISLDQGNVWESTGDAVSQLGNMTSLRPISTGTCSHDSSPTEVEVARGKDISVSVLVFILL